MAEQEQFGPRLRREREKRRIGLEEIATATNVSMELWDGLEKNDFSRWPSGIFARAFVRDYARVVGLDGDAVVDEFCRHFPIADRRASRLIEAHAALIGHAIDPAQGVEPLPAGRERRRPRVTDTQVTPSSPYRQRLIAAGIDAACIAGVALAGAAVTGRGFWASAGVAALLYFTSSTVLTGTSPGTQLLGLLRHRAPALFTSHRAVNV